MKLRALVTGASSGIGECMALQLAERGHDLVLTARRESNLSELASKLRTKCGVLVDIVPLDLGAPGGASKLFKACQERGFQIDILINNAGIGPFRPFLETPWKDHEAMQRLNVLALTELCHLFAPQMLKQGTPSHILNVASVAAYQPVPRFAVYSGSKFQVRIFSEIFRHEMRGTNLNVSCLCPGATATEFLATNNQKLKGSFSPLMPADHVARVGLNGLFARKAVIVPGLFNKLNIITATLLPDSWSIALAGFVMSFVVGERDKA